MKKKILPLISGIMESRGKFYLPAMMFIVAMITQSFVAIAAYRESSLHLSLWNHNTFIVELDGKRYPSDCDFVAENLEPGVHRLRVYSKDHQNHYNQSGHVTIHYNGRIEIPHNSTVITQISSCGDLEILDIIRNSQNAYSNHGHSKPRPRPVSEYRPQQTPGWCGTPVNDDGYGMNNMSAGELDELVQQLEGAWNDDARLATARQAVSQNSLRTEQVMTIMETFWFEKNRLELAKYAYHQVSDPENYYKVNELFWFSASIEELELYIQDDGYTYHN